MNVAAFVDIDHTLVDTNASRLYLRYFYKRGLVSQRKYVYALMRMLLHRCNLLRLNVIEEAAKASEGMSLKEGERVANEAFTRWIEKRASVHMIECLNQHRKKGHMLVLLTAMPDMLAMPFKKKFAFNAMLATQMEIMNGVFTGRIIHLNYGEGKIRPLKEFAKRNEIDLKKSYFYADSLTDAPAMQLVGHPIAVNPDHKLKKFAKEKGWKILEH